MAKVRTIAALLTGNRCSVLRKAGALIAIIAIADWRVRGEIPFAFLYLFPVAMACTVLNPLQIGGLACLCTFLAEVFSDFCWNLWTGTPRDMFYFAAFFGTGMVIRELNRSRQALLEHIGEIRHQSEARREAEAQLRILIDTSPAAIITADASGAVLMANEAAHCLLAVAPGELPGRMIHRYLPSLRNVSGPDSSQLLFRTVMQAPGQREDGEIFLADIYFSTYKTNSGPRLAAMVLDASEELRTHEVSGLHQLLAGSRIAIGALSHEIRNICAAIGAVHQNLSHSGLLTGNKDFDALGNLIAALERIASAKLRQSVHQTTQVDLAALIEELRIVVAPGLNEKGIVVHWAFERGLPFVWADRSTLMQVFLNLITNSVHVLSDRRDGSLSVNAKAEGDRVVIEFADNGGGVSHPEDLFRPFRDGAESTGLGLYLSRAFLRSFGGEIRYVPIQDGACFTVNLNAAGSSVREM